MHIEICPDPAATAQRGAEIIASAASAAVAERGRFILAVSGGHTPWAMLGALATLDAPWQAMHILQIDERIAPAGDPARNIEYIRRSLQAAPLAASQIHAMPVNAGDTALAARQYAELLASLAGSPPVIDFAHLGLGPDGHTASLIPGDPVLASTEPVALSGSYQGWLRMTLTYPVLNAARRILWLVTGAAKSAMGARLMAADASLPAGRVRQERALILADKAAMGLVAG